MRGVVDGGEFQHCVRFNPVDVRDIVTNGLSKVIFWSWGADDRLTALHPTKAPRAPGSKRLGAMTQTTFFPYTTKACTATSTGLVVQWDYPVSELVQTAGREPIKVLELCTDSGINIVSTVLDRYLVCGCQDGAVRFFDFQFRIVAWFEDLAAGPIVATSFADKNTVPALAAAAAAAAGAGDKTGATSAAAAATITEFLVPELLVATAHGKIVRLDAQQLDALGGDGEGDDSAARQVRSLAQLYS